MIVIIADVKEGVICEDWGMEEARCRVTRVRSGLECG